MYLLAINLKVAWSIRRQRRRVGDWWRKWSTQLQFKTYFRHSSTSSFKRAFTPDYQQYCWGRDFILLLPQALCCPDQMLVVMMLSRHRVLSSRTFRPRAPYVVPDVWGTLLGNSRGLFKSVALAIRWKSYRPHLCIDEWNRPTPVCKRLSQIQAVRGKFNLTGLVLFIDMKHGAWMYAFWYAVLSVIRSLRSLRSKDA